MSRPLGHLTSTEYATHCGVVKSRVSAWVSKGMPFVDGTDDHGRLCKYIDPEQADAWRTTFLTPRLDAIKGEVRGVAQHTPREQAAPPSVQQNARPDGGDPRGHEVSSPGHSPPSRPPPLSRAGPSGGELEANARRVARIQEARASREEDAARSARLRRLQVQGILLDREAEFDAFTSFVSKVGVTIDRMAADVASDVANELGVTEHAAYMALRKVGDRLREDLATYAETERDRLGIDEEPPDPAEDDGFDPEAGYVPAR